MVPYIYRNLLNFVFSLFKELFVLGLYIFQSKKNPYYEEKNI